MVRPVTAGTRGASIRDVARAAGVSISTVSRVVNGTAPVAPATRERVEAAIEALGYRPSAIARQLASRSSGTVGLLVPHLSDPACAMVAEGVEAAARARELSVILCQTGSCGEAEHLVRLAELRVAGVVVVASEPDGEEPRDGRYRTLAGEVPLVLAGTGAGAVRVDEREAGYLAAGHLLELGHEKLAFLGGSAGSTVVRRRLEGIERALREAGMERGSTLHLPGGSGFEDGRAAFGRLARREDRPTGLVCVSDLLAAGVLRAAAEMDLSVPEDLSVVGIDDVSLSRCFSPPLTTVARPLRELGRLAVEELVALMAGSEPGTCELKPELVVRGSTGPPDGREEG